MQTFKDSEDRQWTIDLPIGAVLRIKAASEGKFNLLDPSHKCGDVSQLDIVDGFDHLEVFWELLWHLIEPAAKEASVTAEEFGKAMGAEQLLDARVAFANEWRVFFQNLQRVDAATALEKNAKYHAKARQMVEAKLTAALTGIDERMEQAMQTSLNKASGNLQESLDAILGPTPGGNSP